MRRLIIEEPVSRPAQWSPLVASFALAVTSSRFCSFGLSRVDYAAGFAALGFGLGLALVAILLSFLAFVRIWQEGRRGSGAPCGGLSSAWRSSPIRPGLPSRPRPCRRSTTSRPTPRTRRLSPAPALPWRPGTSACRRTCRRRSARLSGRPIRKSRRLTLDAGPTRLSRWSARLRPISDGRSSRR